MSIGVKLDFSDLEKVAKAIDFDVVKKSVKRALMRSRPTLQKAALEQVQTEVNIKSSEWKSKFTKMVSHLKGSAIDQLDVQLLINNRPTNLIDFKVGKKQPMAQKGIPVRSRRNLKFRYAKGKPSRVVDSRLFIARGRSGKPQVYRRKSDAKSTGQGVERSASPIIKQSGPIAWVHFKDAAFTAPIYAKVGMRLQKEFVEAYYWAWWVKNAR